MKVVFKGNQQVRFYGCLTKQDNTISGNLKWILTKRYAEIYQKWGEKGDFSIMLEIQEDGSFQFRIVYEETGEVEVHSGEFFSQNFGMYVNEAVFTVMANKGKLFDVVLNPSSAYAQEKISNIISVVNHSDKVMQKWFEGE